MENIVYSRYMFATIKNHPYRYATVLALITAVISGTNNFLTKIAVTAVSAIFITHTLNGIQLTQMILLTAGAVLIALFMKKTEDIASQQVASQASV